MFRFVNFLFFFSFNESKYLVHHWKSPASPIKIKPNYNKLIAMHLGKMKSGKLVLMLISPPYVHLHSLWLMNCMPLTVYTDFCCYTNIITNQWNPSEHLTHRFAFLRISDPVSVSMGIGTINFISNRYINQHCIP